MEREKIQELIARFNTQRATPDDIRKIEALLEAGSISLDELEDISTLESQVAAMEFPSPTSDLDNRFNQMLAQEKKVKPSFSWRRFLSWTPFTAARPGLAPSLALASVTLIMGIGIGYLIQPHSSSDEMAKVNLELKQLREMMMLSLLEKESATDRLKAVGLSEEMDAASTKVTGALLQTLNEDTNVNVRLAALEALKPYARDSQVREALVRSISKQQSPLVQVALADLMVALQVKSSVKELEKIIQSERTPVDVKNRIKQSIEILI